MPTRILDWSTNPRKAAFFAAGSHKQNVENIAVYALKEIKKSGPILISDDQIRHKNKFLHAQDGVFTKIFGDLYYLKNGEWPSIEKLQEETQDEFFLLKKFVLPAELSSDVLSSLEACGISISTMMPHYSSVAKQIFLREQ